MTGTGCDQMSGALTETGSKPGERSLMTGTGGKRMSVRS